VIRREVREFEHGEFSQPSKTKLILLMVQKSGDHHLTCMKPVVNNGISATNLNPVNNEISTYIYIYLPYQLVEDFFHQQYLVKGCFC